MQDELRDRFGEYPEEVENLFGIIQLKTIASKLGFSKVELLKNQLSLFFPPPEEKAFYESAEGSTGPFQTMMALLPGLRRFKAHLKQDGKQLKLHASLTTGDAAKIVLASAREFLRLLGSDSSTQKEPSSP
jgi:transcription-repair coupling factor (superfamily II helicase)